MIEELERRLRELENDETKQNMRVTGESRNLIAKSTINHCNGWLPIFTINT